MEGGAEVAQTRSAQGLMFISRAHHEEVVAQWREIATAHAKEIREMQERYSDLLARYHELRVAGANPAEKIPEAPKSQLSALGPKTIAALREMSTGLPATSRRAMEAKALAFKAEGMTDDALAAYVRAGETHRNGNGRL